MIEAPYPQSIQEDHLKELARIRAKGPTPFPSTAKCNEITTIRWSSSKDEELLYSVFPNVTNFIGTPNSANNYLKPYTKCYELSSFNKKSQESKQQTAYKKFYFSNRCR